MKPYAIGYLVIRIHRRDCVAGLTVERMEIARPARAAVDGELEAVNWKAYVRNSVRSQL